MKCGYCGQELSAALQERDRLLEALRRADVDCRYCAHRDRLLREEEDFECAAECDRCEKPCPCFSCEEQSNWEWCGFDGGRAGCPAPTGADERGGEE